MSGTAKLAKSRKGKRKIYTRQQVFDMESVIYLALFNACLNDSLGCLEDMEYKVSHECYDGIYFYIDNHYAISKDNDTKLWRFTVDTYPAKNVKVSTFKKAVALLVGALKKERKHSR